MKTIWRDTISALLAVFGGVVMFARLQDYSWWLIGSWKGALGVLAVTGLAIAVTNAVELYKLEDGPALFELFAWLMAATVVIGSLFTTTTQTEFVWSGVFVGFAWLTQTTRDIWRSTHHRSHHYMPV